MRGRAVEHTALRPCSGIRRRRAFLALALGALLLPACGPKNSTPARKRIVLGVVTADSTDPASASFLAGVRAGALEMGRRFGTEVALDVQAPEAPDAQKQALAVEQLVRSGAMGILLWPLGETVLAEAIDRAVEKGCLVLCAGDDAPQSRRFAFLGMDDFKAGGLLLQELAREMGNKGTVGVLAGPKEDPRLTRRLDGLRDALKRHPDLRLPDDDIIHCSAAPEEAAKAADDALAKGVSIDGWALLGPWALRAKEPLQWRPAEAKAVGLDALPIDVPLLEKGRLQVLFIQRHFERGSRAVEVLLRKILLDESPEAASTADLPEKVIRETARDFRRTWDRHLGKPVEESPPEKAESAEKKPAE